MKIAVFSVMDKAVGAFLQPFYSRTKGEAVRQFIDACNGQEARFRQHAEDYTLYELGHFDDNTGMFLTQEPVRVLSAVEALVSDRQ